MLNPEAVISPYHVPEINLNCASSLYQVRIHVKTAQLNAITIATEDTSTTIAFITCKVQLCMPNTAEILDYQLLILTLFVETSL